MADSNNPIKYSDLIKPDNSITELIKQLDELGDAYRNTLNNINTQAIQLRVSLQNVSGATAENRKTIRAASSEADKLAKAKQALAEAESENAKQLAIIRKATAEANQMNKLAAKLADTQAGSYNALSAQYSINKIVLNNMSAEYRRNTKEGQELEKQTREIYEEMKRLQSATGMNQLNVGNYPELTATVVSYVDKVKEAVGLNSEFGNSLLKLGQEGDAAKGVFTAIGDGAKALGRTLLTLLTNPVFLAIAGIAGAGVAFKFWFDYNKGLIEATRLTQQFTGKSGDDLKAYRNEVQALADVYDKDFKEVLMAANALSTQFGISQNEALALVKDGFIAGADANGEFLDTLKEYPAYFKEAGISAKQFIAISSQTATSGVFSDKGVDTIKEGNIRIREMTKATAEALQGIGLNYVEIQKKLQEGSMTTFDVMQQVSEKLNELPESSAAVGTAIADIFGGPGEDAGLQYIKTLKDIDLNLDNVKNKAGELGRLQEEQLKSQAELNNVLAALFDKTGGSFEEMTTRAKVFANDALIWIIKNVIDLTNYVIKLYNDSVAFRAIIQGITLSFSNMWTVVKSLFSYMMENIRIIGQALHGAFTLDWGEVKGAWIRWGENAKKFATTVITGVQDNIQKGVDNMNKTIDPITIPVTVGDTPETGTTTPTGGAPKKTKVADYSKPAKDDAGKKLEASLKKNLELTRKYQDALLALETNEFEKRRKQTEYQYQRQIEDLQTQLRTEKDLTKEGREAILGTIQALEKQQVQELAKIENEKQLAILEQQKQGLQLRLDAAKKGSLEEQKIRLELLEKERQIALSQNAAKPAGQQQNAADINAGFDIKASGIADEYIAAQLEIFDAQQALAQSEFDLLRNSEGRKTRFRLQAEKDRLLKILQLNEQMSNRMSDVEVQTVKNTIAKIDQEIKQSKSEERSGDIYGLFGLNLDDDAKAAISDSTAFALEQLQSVLDAKVAAAEQAVVAAEAEVEASKSKLDAEIEARNQGYANNVVLAQKELDNARKQQDKANKDKAKAIKQQQMLDTIAQTSSLITASANIWASLSGIPVVGPTLATAALALMWGSFAASKIKARQMTKEDGGSESYGEGTVELLQGGSHQSGNDIDLGRKPNGVRRRAEGGEFFAVINKRNSRRFRSIIPDVIKSLNNGTFADKYMRAFSGDGLNINLREEKGQDLKELNDNVRDIKEQGKRRYFVDSDGNIIETYKNLKRRYKR